MIPFFFFAVTDTVAVPIDMDVVYLHEWGVIEFDEAVPAAVGAQWGYLNDQGMLEPYYEYEVEAPVIWFHGAECTGTLYVEAYDGYFSAYLPYPDSIVQEDEERIANPESYQGQISIWRNVNLSWNIPEMEESLPVAYEPEGFSWATPFWREVPANYVAVPGEAYLDRFIYYECTFNTSSDLFRDCMSAGSVYGYTGEALVFQEENGELAAHPANVDGSVQILNEILPQDEILEVICGWSGNRLKSQEIEALYQTWEPSINNRCINLGMTTILFPLSDEQTESISSIRFEPEYGNPVEYARLFLGLGEVRL